jgi:DNA-binding CsgD family transcriptional regulator
MHSSIEHQLKSIWKSFYGSSESISSEVSDVEEFPLFKFLDKNGISVIQTNFNDLTVKYVSENIEENIGLNKELLHKEGLLHIIKYLIPSQQKYPSVITNLLAQVFSNWAPDELKTLRVSVVGLRIKHPEKGYISIIYNPHAINWDDNGLPISALVILQDITHFMKDDSYWVKIWNSATPKTLFFHSKEEFEQTDDILSLREKDIFKLIILGKNPEEIANQLFISKITVNNHRQKILDKFCVKDSTALIGLYKLIGFPV